MKIRTLLFYAAMVCFLTIPIGDGFSKTITGKDKGSESKEDTMRKRIEEKKVEINGREWQIDIKSPSGKGELDGPDTLTFQDNHFKSKVGSKIGFTPTNYTLTLSESEEGPTVWETMQTSGKGKVMFWRGEFMADTMTGVISRQLDDDKGNEEYFFRSAGMKKIPASSSKEEKEVESAAASDDQDSKTSAATGTLDSAKSVTAEELMKSTSKNQNPPATTKEKTKKKKFF